MTNKITKDSIKIKAVQAVFELSPPDDEQALAMFEENPTLFEGSTIQALIEAFPDYNIPAPRWAQKLMKQVQKD